MKPNFDNFIWAERYRPKNIEDLVLSSGIRTKFEEYIQEKEIPHLLLFGPNGSGKTTMATILMDSIPCQKLILNASGEDRGVATIKGKVKQFASSMSYKDTLKIILLDEADFLTIESQTALRNTMETYSSTCRFILTGNYVDRIRKEIKSRCTQYEFSQYSVKRLMKHLLGILKEEGVKADEGDIVTLINSFYPDIRSIINNLQICSVNGKFDPDLITSTSLDIEDLTKNIVKGNIKSLRKLWVGMTDYTFIYKFLFDEFIFTINEEDRPEVAEVIAEFMYRDATIADRELNVTTCCMMIMKKIGASIKFDE